MQIQTDSSINQPILDINEAFSSTELLALCDRIIASGILGRSKHYTELLEYLAQCSLSGKSPKEIELAVDVLNRGVDFDVSSDSRVRVYIHQLRKKLDSFYQSYEHEAPYRIVIPKGQYTIMAQHRASKPDSGISRKSHKSNLSLNNGLLVSVIILLAINLIYMAIIMRDNRGEISQAAAEHPVWDSVLRDDSPILIVMGDYYIFGELNANGNVARMVREFSVN